MSIARVAIFDEPPVLDAGEHAVRDRPVADQRGIRPDRIERWIIDSSF